MIAERQILGLLKIVVPGETSLSVASEVAMLEILGIVSSPELVKAMHLSALLVPAATPATLKGLIQLLGGLMKMNPKSTKDHHDTIAKVTASLATSPDVPLTFGTFLPICDALLQKASHHRGKHKTS